MVLDAVIEGVGMSDHLRSPVDRDEKNLGIVENFLKIFLKVWADTG